MLSFKRPVEGCAKVVIPSESCLTLCLPAANCKSSFSWLLWLWKFGLECQWNTVLLLNAIGKLWKVSYVSYVPKCCATLEYFTLWIAVERCQCTTGVTWECCRKVTELANATSKRLRYLKRNTCHWKAVAIWNATRKLWGLRRARESCEHVEWQCH